MGSLLSRHRGGGDSDSTESGEPGLAPSSAVALTILAAEHWLTLHQLYFLFIVDDAAPSSLPPNVSPFLPCHSSHLLSSSPPFSPASAAKCSAKRHAPNCCCAATSSSSPPTHDPPHLSLTSDFHPFSLQSTAPPPPSPADRSICPPSEHSAYRSAIARDALYLGAIRPLLHSALLDCTDLDPDCLSLALDYLVSPPSLTPTQLVGLALLSPQHLHPHQLRTTAPAPAFSDLVLSDSGCFVHRRGVVDRARSMRAQQLRLNFATLHTGLWRVAEREGQEQLQLDVNRVEEWYFDQRLYKERAHRMACMRIAPYDERVAEECSRSNHLCLCNDLLVVCGDENLS